MLDFNFTITVPGAEEILQRLTSLEERVMAAKEDIQAAIAQIGENTSNIAADIERILAQMAGGMSAEEVEAVKVQLQAKADALKAVADVVPE